MTRESPPSPSRPRAHYWRLRAPEGGVVRGYCLTCRARYRRRTRSLTLGDAATSPRDSRQATRSDTPPIAEVTTWQACRPCPPRRPPSCAASLAGASCWSCVPARRGRPVVAGRSPSGDRLNARWSPPAQAARRPLERRVMALQWSASQSAAPWPADISQTSLSESAGSRLRRFLPPNPRAAAVLLAGASARCESVEAGDPRRSALPPARARSAHGRPRGAIVTVAPVATEPKFDQATIDHVLARVDASGGPDACWPCPRPSQRWTQTPDQRIANALVGSSGHVRAPSPSGTGVYQIGRTPKSTEGHWQSDGLAVFKTVAGQLALSWVGSTPTRSRHRFPRNS